MRVYFVIRIIAFIHRKWYDKIQSEEVQQKLVRWNNNDWAKCKKQKQNNDTITNNHYITKCVYRLIQNEWIQFDVLRVAHSIFLIKSAKYIIYYLIEYFQMMFAFVQFMLFNKQQSKDTRNLAFSLLFSDDPND